MAVRRAWVLIFICLAALPPQSHSMEGPSSLQPRIVFGPEVFQRASGSTDTYSRSFTVPSYVQGPYTLLIENGKSDGQNRIEDAISSGSVFVNGVEIIKKSDFNQNVGTIERTVSLGSDNSITILLNSAPESFVILTISGLIPIGDLAHPRSGHTATALPSGEILVSGGTDAAGPLGEAERFDPLTLTFSPLGANLATPRGEHAGSVLADETHLLTAGEDGTGSRPVAEIYDPVTGYFETIAQTLNVARAGHTATVLLDGRVLITGGHGSGPIGPVESFDAQDAVLFKPSFDPALGSFQLLAEAMPDPRWNHTATLLPDGKVLIAGGQTESESLASMSLFDPITETFSPLAETLTIPRAGHTATLLSDGRVLFLGGRNAGGFLASAETYDPSTGTFAPSPDLILPRANHTASLLYFGEIVIAGGENETGVLGTAEFYGPPQEDLLSPYVLSVSVEDGLEGVDLAEVIGIRFSEPLDITTLNTSSIQLFGETPVDFIVSPSEGGLMVFLAPQPAWEAGSPYTLSVTSDVTDPAGNPLIPYSMTFTTVAAPLITGLSPGQGFEGSAVTIIGEHFDPAIPSLNVVKFGESPAVVSSATPTAITTAVPPDMPIGPVTVTVTTRGGTAGAPFTVEDPVPVADAGPDQTVLQFDTVILDGSGSFDPNGDSVAYVWSFASVPTGSSAVLQDSNTSHPSFLADKAGEYTTRLIVSDGSHSSGEDTVVAKVTPVGQITVSPFSPSVSVGETIQMTATGTFFDESRLPIASKDVTQYATWSSTDVSVAAVDASGLATGIGPGFTSIKASIGRPSASQTLRVSPFVSSLSPDSVIVWSSQFEMTVYGSGFVPESTAQFIAPDLSITSLSTTFISMTELRAELPEVILSTAASASIQVANPISKGGNSTTVPFSILYPVPMISSVSPENVHAGDPFLVLTIHGEGFIPGSGIYFNGQFIPSSPRSGNEILGFISPEFQNTSILSLPGDFAIKVVNPSPGGGPSNDFIYSVAPNHPAVLEISRTKLAQGSLHQRIKIKGERIRPGFSPQISGEGLTIHEVEPVHTYEVSDNQPDGLPYRSWFLPQVSPALDPCDNCYSQEVRLELINFNFNIFGQPIRQFFINSNGLITFDDPSDAPENVGIPTLSVPNFYLAPFWDDLTDGTVRATISSSSYPDRVFLVRWDSARICCEDPSSNLSFEIVLFEKSQIIMFQYRSLSGSDSGGQAATIGMEGPDGTSGVSYLQDGTPTENLLQEGRAITFRPTVPEFVMDISIAEDAVLGARDLIITNANGTTVTIPGAFTIIPNPIQLAIDSPASGDIISRDTVMVQGTVDAGDEEVGVVVNGVLAHVNNGRFVANDVPLTLGENTLTAIATDFEGNNLARSVTVTTEDLREALRLLANPVSGVAPLPIQFSILLNTNATVTIYTLDADGDGAADFTDAVLPETIPFTYSEPGLYFATLTLTDDQGTLYTDTLAINVLSLAELDALLQGRWNEMKSALTNKDVKRALAYVASGAQEMYRENFTLMQDLLPQIAEEMADIQFVQALENAMIYEINVIRNGQLYSFEVQFVTDVDGQWKIRFF